MKGAVMCAAQHLCALYVVLAHFMSTPPPDLPIR
jgi:hypothetical protein